MAHKQLGDAAAEVRADAAHLRDVLGSMTKPKLTSSRSRRSARLAPRLESLASALERHLAHASEVELLAVFHRAMEDVKGELATEDGVTALGRRGDLIRAEVVLGAEAQAKGHASRVLRTFTLCGSCAQGTGVGTDGSRGVLAGPGEGRVDELVSVERARVGGGRTASRPHERVRISFARWTFPSENPAGARGCSTASSLLADMSVTIRTLTTARDGDDRAGWTQRPGSVPRRCPSDTCSSASPRVARGRECCGRSAEASRGVTSHAGHPRANEREQHT